MHGPRTMTTGVFGSQYGISTAAATATAAPVVIRFALFERFIVGGLIAGVVKG